MLFVSVPGARRLVFFDHRAARLTRTFARGATLRLVAHLDVDDAGVERTIAAFRDFYR